MKTWFSGFALWAYLSFYTCYIICLKYVPMTQELIKLWNYYCLAGLFSSIVLFEHLGIETYIQQTFINISKAILLITFIIIILHYHLILISVHSQLFFLYLGTLFATTCIFFSGWQHGYYKTQYEND